MARDYHSLWLNSAALARANGDLQVPGGVVERDEHGEPTGVLREECAWHFRDALRAADARGDGGRLARGNPARELPRRRRDPRQGRLARSARRLPGAPAGRRPHAAGVAVASARPRRPARRDRHLGRPRRRIPQGRLHQGLHGRDARLADSAHARRLGGRDHEPGRARGHRQRGLRARASRSRSTPSATSRTGRRSTPSRRRRTSGARAGSALASSTPSSLRRRTCRASRSSASRPRCSSATRPRTETSPTASGAT